MAKQKAGALAPTAKNLNNPNVLQVSEGVEGITSGMGDAEIMARIATRGHMTAHAMRAYSGFDKETLTVTAMNAELRANGDAVVGGDLGRVERMLVAQAITLDTIFANLAERSTRQDYIKNAETYLRLALKAQAQCRSTAEALAMLKNPQPYIRQTNISQGHQQVNNGYQSGNQALGNQQDMTVQPGEKTNFVPSKLLEAVQ